MSFSFPVTSAVVDSMLFRLTANNEGFNETFNRLAPNYGLPANMGIIFSPTLNQSSPNFAKANIMPQEWIQASTVKFPFMTLYSGQTVNENSTKFHQFSGCVYGHLNVFLSWDQGRVIQDFQSLMSCVEETVYTVFNRARAGHPGDQDWDAPSENVDVVFNGDIEMTPSRVQRGERSWEQVLMFKLTFQVDAKGEN